MASKKKRSTRIRINKNRRAQLVKWGVPFVVGFVFLNIGIVGTRFLDSRISPGNIVWAADETAKIPTDLRKFLNNRDDCQNYRGESTPTGVGLWGVYQVSGGKFAKISYGCSWSLTSYKMAVKQSGDWILLLPTDYFAPFAGSNSAGALPYCKVIDNYKIPKDIEPFCIKDDGSAISNEN